MTISSTSNKIIFAGNGATTSFSFTFPAIEAEDIQAFYTDSSGNITTLVQGSGTTQYQVSLNAAVPPNPTGTGGTVTYNPSGTPITVGTLLTIIRTMDLTQGTSLANQGTLYPTVIEQEFDALLAQIQQIAELQGRAITVAVSDDAPETLPAAAARANKYMGFDSDGNPVAVDALTPGTTVSVAMAPVVTAATLAAGRTAFGLGDIAVEDIGAGLQDDGAGNVRVNTEVTTADTTNQTVTSAFHNTQRVATGAITYTLPRANTLWNGFTFQIENLQAGGDVTFAINVNDTFQNYTSGTSFIIGRGASLEIWTDAAASGTWYYRLSGGKKLVGDTAYTITPADRNILTSAAFTASRAWTLPAAAAVKAGTAIVIADQQNTLTSTNTLVITRAGADTIVSQGTTVNTFTLFTAGANVTLISDGVSKWNIISCKMGMTVTRLTSGAGATFTATVGATRHRVQMWGPGGGGGGSTANNGNPGNPATSFQVNATGTAWTAAVGSAGLTNAGAAGAGGTGGTNGSTGTLIARVSGGNGGCGQATATANTILTGGWGGNSPLLMGGGTNNNQAAGGNANTNTGGGGGGGGGNSATTSGGGGGSGEHVSFWVYGMTSATYTIGTGGTGGAAGTRAGGNGADGIIIIEEFFD